MEQTLCCHLMMVIKICRLTFGRMHPGPGAVMAVLALLNLMTACTAPEMASGSGPDLRILTYNVWYGFTQVAERKGNWLIWMKRQKPDIVFLQELNTYTPQQLKEDAATWDHPHSVLLKLDGFPTGITSRFPIEDAHRFTEGFHHGLIRAKIRGIYFYTIHLHPSNWETRNTEIDLILADMEHLPSRQKIVLAGDFNTFSSFDSTYYSHRLLEPFFMSRDLKYDEHNLNSGKLDYTAIGKLMNHGFRDTEFLMRDKEYTFTGSFPTQIEKPGDHGQKRRLDYVFVSESMSQYVRRATIIANDTTQHLSDHLPMIVDLKLPR